MDGSARSSSGVTFAGSCGDGHETKQLVLYIKHLHISYFFSTASSRWKSDFRSFNLIFELSFYIFLTYISVFEWGTEEMISDRQNKVWIPELGLQNQRDNCAESENQMQSLKGSVQLEKSAALTVTHLALQMKGRWESNINVWLPFMYSQKWNCYYQNRFILFCLPVPSFIYLW